jgi:hypothetical protein
MGRKKMPGLVKRGNIWHINKKVNGRRISESTGSGLLEEAERYLVRRLEQIRQASVYGIRPKRTFQEAATKYLMEHQHKASLHVDAGNIKALDKFIGGLSLDGIHMGTLQPYIGARRKEGVKARTINHGLQIVRRILNLAASEWLDEYGLTWIAVAPKIRLFSELDRQQPYPLDRQEQARSNETRRARSAKSRSPRKACVDGRSRKRITPSSRFEGGTARSLEWASACRTQDVAA